MLDITDLTFIGKNCELCGKKITSNIEELGLFTIYPRKLVDRNYQALSLKVHICKECEETLRLWIYTKCKEDE